MSQMGQGIGENSQIFDLYEAYLEAERIYLSKPTGDHWEHKEVAYEAYQSALSHYNEVR